MSAKNNKSSTGDSVWIPGDQLMAQHPLLDQTARDRCVIVMIESLGRRRERPYHKQKITLILSAMRHYAAALRARGWQVDYRIAESFSAGLQAHLKQFGSTRLLTMAGAEWRLRQAQHGLSERLDIPVTVIPNAQFLVAQYAPEEKPGGRLILENFYRAMRRHFDLLIEADGRPTGGRWNYDRENRRPYDVKLKPPSPMTFSPDRITREVMREVEQCCPENIGSTEGFSLAVTREQALEALDDFITQRLADFGPYEDAMGAGEPLLFHSQLAPLLNLGLLEPLETAQRAVAAYRAGSAPLNSVEGFIRQVIGWREYVYWRYHQMMPGLHEHNYWQADKPLPGFFWTGETDMNCLRHIIGRVLKTGYSHHIERLMVLCNFALLTGVRPAEVNDWFLACYADAYDWVVTPNVIGMGLNADGGQVGTKPYIASAAYINRMSDYCGECRFSPKERTGADACPFNFLYWNFLLKWEKRLRESPRMGPNVLGLRHLDEAGRRKVRRQARKFLQTQK